MAAAVTAIASFIPPLTVANPSMARPARPAGPAVTRRRPVIPGTRCPSFPADAAWNTPITHLPVDSHSASWLAAMHASTTYLHPDYGPSGDRRIPYGIPYTVVKRSTPLTKIKFEYASQSDKGRYPFTARTPIEGGQHAGGDRHAIMVNGSTCVLYELWHARYRRSGSTAGSGAIWTLRRNRLRPPGWTSADAAGLPILPLLVNYDQVRSGTMNHAIRVTAACTQQSYLWPARHEAGQANPDCPPMGARFRLDARFRLAHSQCSRFCQTVIATMKKYGLIVADNGSNWFFQGTMDRRWTSHQVDQLKQIPAKAFEAVNESCLKIKADSAEANQPGTPGYARHCSPRGASRPAWPLDRSRRWLHP